MTFCGKDEGACLHKGKTPQTIYNLVNESAVNLNQTLGFLWTFHVPFGTIPVHLALGDIEGSGPILPRSLQVCL